MIIGVVSDIHGNLTPQAAAALEGSDLIICAGDIERPQILWELEAIAPTTIVQGNCDHFHMLPTAPRCASPRIGGVRFFVTHRPQDVGTPAEDVDVVIYGHTHMPRDTVVDGVRYINPGSASRPRGGSVASIAKITIDHGRIDSVEFIDLT